MTLIDTYLQQRTPLVLDGALGTELERRGADINDPLWSARLLVEAPDLITAVHRDYLEAGADIIITASYQASYEGFMGRGMTKIEAKNLIQSAVTLAKQTVEAFWADQASQGHGFKPLVAASVGPYGAFLADGSEFQGNYGVTEKDLILFHEKRLQTLMDAGPDLLACETLPCLAEAKALARLLKNFPSAQAWVSFSAKDGWHTSNGEPIKACAAFLDTIAQVSAVGINCTAPAHIISLIREIRSATDKPVIVYPNKGGIFHPLTNDWDPDPRLPRFEQMARQWADAGARLIGGCCHTSPDDIRALAQAF